MSGEQLDSGKDFFIQFVTVKNTTWKTFKRFYFYVKDHTNLNAEWQVGTGTVTLCESFLVVLSPLITLH